VSIMPTLVTDSLPQRNRPDLSHTVAWPKPAIRFSYP
jgi:hypothetical protein